MWGNHSARLRHSRVLPVLPLVFLAALASGCDPIASVIDREHISPFIARSNPAGGGYEIPNPTTAEAADARGAGRGKEKRVPNVKELRARQPLPVDLDTLRLPGAASTDKTAYELAAINKGDRNRLQDYLRRVSDDICLAHKGDIMGYASATNFALSAVTSTLGGVGAIVTGVTATRALSGSAAISNAIREDVDQNIFYNNIAPAILRQIDLQRQKVMQEIEPKRTKDIADYSVDEAIRDIAEYHNQCSFGLAVASLANDNKRPATADELQGRIQSLRDQYQKNADLIDKAKAANDPSTQKQLQSQNKIIDNMIQSLTMQLGLAQGAPVASDTEAKNGVTASVDSSAQPLDALSSAIGSVASDAEKQSAAFDKDPLKSAINLKVQDTASALADLKKQIGTSSGSVIDSLTKCQPSAIAWQVQAAKAKAGGADAGGGDNTNYNAAQAQAVAAQVQEFSAIFVKALDGAIGDLTTSANGGTPLNKALLAGATANIKAAGSATLTCINAPAPAAATSQSMPQPHRPAAAFPLSPAAPASTPKRWSWMLRSLPSCSILRPKTSFT